MSAPVLVISILLLLISSCAWTVMLTKYRAVSVGRKSTGRFLALFRSSKDPLSAYASGVRADDSLAFRVYETGCKAVASQVMGDCEPDESFRARIRAAGPIPSDHMKHVQLAMEREARDGVEELERTMPVLSLAVSVAPFLGLLGTVWGVMGAFSGAADGTEAGLAAFSPGVTSALLTTVIALVVAIPAVFGYNYLAHLIRSTVVEVDDFSAEFYGMLEHQYVDHRGTSESASQRDLAPVRQATRSSAHSLMLDRPVGAPRAENVRRSAKKVSKPADPRQPSLLDDVDDLKVGKPVESAEESLAPKPMAKAETAPREDPATSQQVAARPSNLTRPITVSAPPKAPASQPVPSPAQAAQTRQQRPHLPAPQIIEPPVAAKPAPNVVGVRTGASPVVEKKSKSDSDRTPNSVADLIAAEKKRGAGLLLRTLRRAPKRRETEPAEL